MKAVLVVLGVYLIGLVYTIHGQRVAKEDCRASGGYAFAFADGSLASHVCARPGLTFETYHTWRWGGR